MVEFREIRLESLKDSRIAALTRLGGGELVATFLGTFEGQPAFFINDYAALEFGEADKATIVAYVFETEEARTALLDELAERTPLWAGRRPAHWPPMPPRDRPPEPRGKPHPQRRLMLAGLIAGALVAFVALAIALFRLAAAYPLLLVSALLLLALLMASAIGKVLRGAFARASNWRSR